MMHAAYRTLLGLSGLVALGAATQAQTAFRPAPFTQEQVDAGRIAYNEACAACHGRNLQDGTHRTPLIGPGFLVGWGSRSTADYFRYVQTRMPYREPNTLPPETTAAIVAYIYAANGAQPGGETMTAQSDVRINAIADGVVREPVLTGISRPQ